MNVSPVSSTLSFSARTRIDAPENLLSEDLKKKFIEKGDKIGKSRDTIDITVSDVFQKEENPGVDVYTVSNQTKFDGDISRVAVTLPVKKIPPEKYLNMLFKQWSR